MLDIIDVRYEDVVADVEGVIRSVFDRRGVPLRDETVRRIKTWEAENAQHRWGRHEYSLERYYFTEDEIVRVFSTYRGRFMQA